MGGFTAALQKFGIGRLAAVLGVAAGVAAVLVAVMLRMGQAPDALLYSNLDLREASEISAALDQAGIKYSSKGDGSTIMVNRDEVGTARMLVAGKGLVTSGSVGYELFDSQSVLGLHLEEDLWPNLGGLGYELNTLSRWQGETQRRHVDGHTYPQWEIVTPVQDEKGVISHFVICFEDISERKAAERRIQDLAYYDELTGLPNRRYLDEVISKRTIMNVAREGLAILHVDLDRFKQIND